MSSPLRTVAADMRMTTIAEVLRREGIGSVVVAEGEGIEGIVTESDLVRGVGAGHDAERMTAARLMTADVVTIAPDATVQAACDRMAAEDVKRLPVVDHGPLGIVTTTDVAHALAQDIDDVLAAFQ